MPIAHLPVITAAIDALGITEALDEALPIDPRSKVSDTDCVKIMLANTLCGRCALLHMPEWLERVDGQQLVPEGATPELFNDQRLASCLDRIHAYGTDNLLSLMAKRYLATEPEGEYIAHLDHTTIALTGDYESAHQMAQPRPAHGYSKDHKPHFKQLLFGLVLAGSANVPVAATMLSGNTAESKANRLHLDKLASLMPSPDSVTLVADCKLVDGETLGALHQHGMHFVSMLPSTFNIRSELIERVRVSGEPLDFVLEGAARSKKSPARTYWAKSFQEPVLIGKKGGEKQPEGKAVMHRFVVVRSDEHAPGLAGPVQRSLESDLGNYERALKALTKAEFACEPDARSAIAALQQRLKLHDANLAPVQVSKPVKRRGPGRPRKDEIREERTYFQIQETAPPTRDTELVERADFHARHFVLITNHLDEEAWPDERVLREYRAQQVIEGHTGFRWLKNMALVAPIFLHLPTRIAALGLIFVMALMVRNYIQATIRTGLKATGTTIPDRLDRPTQKPTMETAMRHLAAVVTTTIYIGDRWVEKRVQGLTPAGRHILKLLGLDEDVYLKPPGSRKWRRVCHRMAEM